MAQHNLAYGHKGTAQGALRRNAGHGVKSAGGHRLPGDEAWLVGELRASGEKKYYLTNHKSGTTLKVLAAAIKARWSCEQAHQQMKEELGLDHFEGKGECPAWQGPRLDRGQGYITTL